MYQFHAETAAKFQYGIAVRAGLELQLIPAPLTFFAIFISDVLYYPDETML